MALPRPAHVVLLTAIATGLPARTTFKLTARGAAAPTITLQERQPSGLGFRNASFAWTTTGDVTDVACVIDSQPAVPCSSVERIAILAIGSHTFTASASGAYGTVPSPPYTWTIVAPTPPVITPGSFTGPASSTVARNATFTWQVQTLPPYTPTCTVDGAAVAGASGVALGPFSPGAVTFLLTIANAAGTASASANWMITAAPPGGPAPTSVLLPTISGAPRTHAILTASTGTWSGSPFAYSYVWRRCDTDDAACTDIPRATGATYSPTPLDVAHRLRVAVVATSGGGDSTAPVSAAASTRTS